jgi:hypothetical protein
LDNSVGCCRGPSNERVRPAIKAIVSEAAWISTTRRTTLLDDEDSHAGQARILPQASNGDLALDTDDAGELLRAARRNSNKPQARSMDVEIAPVVTLSSPAERNILGWIHLGRRSEAVDLRAACAVRYADLKPRNARIRARRASGDISAQTIGCSEQCASQLDEALETKGALERAQDNRVDARECE